MVDTGVISCQAEIPWSIFVPVSALFIGFGLLILRAAKSPGRRQGTFRTWVRTLGVYYVGFSGLMLLIMAAVQIHSAFFCGHR